MIVRKTFFDDCKGERIQELLVSFSSLVLRKVLAAGQGGKACIAARFATAKSVTGKEQQSFLPLAIAHRASLTAILRKKNELRERYKSFGRTLNAKGQELDRRFDVVVSTQDFLDKNPIPDHTVARVSKLFEKNWHGDRKPVEVITQGEEHGMTDSLLDRPFSDTWQQVSAGTFDGAAGTSWQGLLQDLEERVAKQEARLTDWRNFKEAMQRDETARSAANNTDSSIIRTRYKDAVHQKQRDPVLSARKSPNKSNRKVGKGLDEPSPIRPKGFRKENTQDELKERDLVFSPRKSPRKSMWPVEDLGAETSPTHSRAIPMQKEPDDTTTLTGNVDDISEDPVQDQLIKAQERDAAELSSHASSVDDGDESGFSEISDRQLHSSEHSDHTRHSDQDESSSNPNNKEGERKASNSRSSNKSRPPDHSHMLFTKDSNPATSGDDDSWISSLPVEDKQEDETSSQSPDEDDRLAEQIVSMTINAAPTPAKPKVSLMERTRQSMAFASPLGLQNLLPEGPSPIPFPPLPSKTPHRTTGPTGPTTLLERTRQSISLVPAKPKASRKSTLDRRTSKLYPTNQFETPRRQLDRVAELTPPEELFGPGAGYDSVFKSRPKIALSPNPSPGGGDEMEAEDEEGEGGGGGKGQGQREESPLARMTAKV